MTVNKLIKEALKEKMPPENCVDTIIQNQLYKKHGSMYFKLSPACVALLLLIAIAAYTPIKAFATNLLNKITINLYLNDKKIQTTEAERYNITIPEHLEETVIENDIYYSKAYHSVDDLEKELGVSLLKWNQCDKFKENGILLNIKNNDYARITFIYDPEEIIKLNNDSFLFSGLLMQVYIPLSDTNEINKFLSDEGISEWFQYNDDPSSFSYRTNSTYELVEEYYSDILSEKVLILKKKFNTDVYNPANNETISSNQNSYDLYFIYKDMLYYINCGYDDLDTIHNIINNLSE